MTGTTCTTGRSGKRVVGGGKRLAMLLALAIGILAAERTAMAQLGGQAPATQPPPPAAQPSRQPEPYYVTTRFSFDDVDVKRLVERFNNWGISLPFTVEGTVSTRLQVQWPIGALASPKAYRVHGTASSERLVVAGFEVQDASAAATYANGILTLEQLEFEVADMQAADPAGKVTGSAALQLIPRGDLTAALQADGVPLSRLQDLVPGLAEFASGRLSGQVQTRVPSTQLRDVAEWQAQGTIRGTQLQAYDLPETEVRADFRIADGVLTLPQLLGQMQQTQLGGSAQLNLTAPFAYQTRLGVTLPQLDLLEQWRALQASTLRLAGDAQATVQASGTLSPLSVSASGEATMDQLQLYDWTAETVTFQYILEDRAISLRQLSANLYGGNLSGSVSWPLDSQGNVIADIQWKDVAMPPLLGQQAPAGMSGSTTGNAVLTVPLAQSQEAASWQAEGELAVTGEDLYDWQQFFGRTRFELAQGRLELSGLEAALDQSLLELRGGLNIASPYAFRADVNWQQVKLSRLRAIPAAEALSAELAGVIDFEGQLQGDLQPPDVQLDGKLAGSNLQLQQLAVDALTTHLEVSDQHVQLRDAVATLYGGRASGQVTIPRTDTATGQLAVRWQGVHLNQLVQRSASLPIEIAGRSDGSASATIPAGSWQQPQLWQATLDTRIDQMLIAGWQAQQVALKARLRDQQLDVEQLSARMDEAGLEASGQIAVAEPYTYQVQAELKDGDLAQFNNLPEDYRLPFTIAGNYSLNADLQGQLQPLRAVGSGSGSANKVMLDDAEIEALSFEFESQADQLDIRDAQFRMYGGQLHGSARIPLADDVAATLGLQWQEIDLGQLAGDTLELPVPVEAISRGQVQLDAPAGSFADLPSWSGRASLNIDDILARGVTVGAVEAELDLAEQTLRFQATGSLLDGRLQADGTWPLPTDRFSSAAGTLAGEVQLQAAELARLGAVYPRLEPLSGQADLLLAISGATDDGGDRSGRGRLALSNLEWNNTQLADRLQGRLYALGPRLFLDDITGSFAGGRLRAAMQFDLAGRGRSTFDFALLGVRTQQAMAAWPDLADWLDGVADVRLRGDLSGVWRAGGRAVVRRGQLAAVSVDALRMPLQLRYDPLSGRGELEIRGANMQVARGRVAGDLTLAWARGLDVDAEARFSGVDVQTLLQQLGSRSQVGSGTITGNLALSGDRVRSVSDLSGAMEAELRDTQAFQFPILRQVQPYVASGVTGSTRFNEGQLIAYLNRGVVRVEHMTLASRDVQLYARGTMSLAGRLQLNVVAATGQYRQAQPLAQLLLARLPAAAAPPVALLATANEFLSDRVLHLLVTGTIRSPTVRVQPLPMLQAEAVRFFLRRAAGLAPLPVVGGG